MRRILASLAPLILAVFCAACGEAPPHGNEANTTTNGNTTTTTTNAGGTLPTPTPVENDKITVEYPNRFLQDDSDEERGKVTFLLERVQDAVIATKNTNGNTTTVTSTPDPIKGGQAGTFSPAVNADDFNVYIKVTLFAEGLIIINAPPEPERLYKPSKYEDKPPEKADEPCEKSDKPCKEWKWRLKPDPKAREGDPVSLRFQVDLRWEAKKPGVASPEPIARAWESRFSAEVGPPARRVNAALYGSPLFAAGGFVTIGTSRRKRKGLTDVEPEEDGIEDQPETATAEAMPATRAKMAAPEAEVEDEVSGTVYAPGQAAQGDSFLVQVFIHLPEQADALDEIAKEADEDAKRRISSKLQKKIKRGTELTFHLQMPGLVIDDDVQSCVWMGEPAWVQFGVTVPEDSKPKNIIGTVTLSEASVPVGHLRFKFKITSTAPSEGEAEATSLEPAPAGNLTRYQQAFISYASKDRQEVLKRVQMLNVAKVKFFQDLLTLEPGDEWEKLLYEYIDKSDVFFLFWSQAASESEWVKKEVEYAIKRRADKELPDPEIIPVIIEGPPPAKPPAELSSIHFNDKLIYFINTRET